MSNYSQAKYYFETLDENDKIIKNCGSKFLKIYKP